MNTKNFLFLLLALQPYIYTMEDALNSDDAFETTISLYGNKESIKNTNPIQALNWIKKYIDDKNKTGFSIRYEGKRKIDDKGYFGGNFSPVSACSIVSASILANTNLSNRDFFYKYCYQPRKDIKFNTDENKTISYSNPEKFLCIFTNNKNEKIANGYKKDLLPKFIDEILDNKSVQGTLTLTHQDNEKINYTYENIDSIKAAIILAELGAGFSKE